VPAEKPALAYDAHRRLGDTLITVGVIGAIAALVVGVAGWGLAGRATRSLTATIEPISGVVANVVETIEVIQVMVSRTTEAIESIEGATRSTARTLDSVSGVIDETAELMGGGMADGLDSAVATLPGLIDTGRVVDRTMRALSLVGVDYDPDLPLDEALGDLEQSLRPIPGQLRDQVVLLGAVQDDIAGISVDAGELAGILGRARIDMIEAESILVEVGQSARLAAERVGALEADVGTYEALARVVVIAGTIALLVATSTPLLIGLHYRRRDV